MLGSSNDDDRIVLLVLKERNEGLSPVHDTEASEQRVKPGRVSLTRRSSNYEEREGKETHRFTSIIFLQAGRLSAKVPPPAKTAALSIRTLEDDESEIKRIKRLSAFELKPPTSKHLLILRERYL